MLVHIVLDDKRTDDSPMTHSGTTFAAQHSRRLRVRCLAAIQSTKTRLAVPRRAHPCALCYNRHTHIAGNEMLDGHAQALIPTQKHVQTAVQVGSSPAAGNLPSVGKKLPLQLLVLPSCLDEEDPGGPVILGTTTGGTATFRRQSPGAATPRSRVGYTALWQREEGAGEEGGVKEVSPFTWSLAYGSSPVWYRRRDESDPRVRSGDHHHMFLFRTPASARAWRRGGKKRR